MHFVMIRDLVARSVYRQDCGGIDVIMILTCLVYVWLGAYGHGSVKLWIVDLLYVWRWNCEHWIWVDCVV